MSLVVAPSADAPRMEKFTLSTFVTDGHLNGLMSIVGEASKDLAVRCIQQCASKYGFNANEAIAELGFMEPGLMKRKPRQMVNESQVAIRPRFPLPYSSTFGDSKNRCQAININHGLYTQCFSPPTDTRIIVRGEVKRFKQYCNGCARKMEKYNLDSPKYGTVEQRKAVGIMDYVDPFGGKPVPYMKVLQQFNRTINEVNDEASKFCMTIDPIHFEPVPEPVVVPAKRARPAEGEEGGQDHDEDEAPAKQKKVRKPSSSSSSKGRPKKSEVRVEIDNGDAEEMFTALVADVDDNEDDDVPPPPPEDEPEEEVVAKPEPEPVVAKEPEAKAVKATKVPKTDKAPKPAKEPKAVKEPNAVKEHKAVKEPKAVKPVKAPEATKAPELPKDEVIKKITIDGVTYLRVKRTGVIYDYRQYLRDKTLNVIGKWSTELNKIVFTNQEEALSSDSDSSDEDDAITMMTEEPKQPVVVTKAASSSACNDSSSDDDSNSGSDEEQEDEYDD